MTSERDLAEEATQPNSPDADPEAEEASADAEEGITSVRGRLLFALALVAALIAAPSLYTLFRLEGIGDIARDLRSEYATSSVVLGTLQGSFADLDRSVRAFVATGDSALAEDVHEAHRKAAGAVAQLEAAGFTESTRGVDTTLSTLAAGVARIEAAVREGRLQEATALLETLKPLIVQDSALAAIASAIDRESMDTVDRAEEASRAAGATLLGSLLVTLVLAAIVAFWITRNISAPLGHLEAATGRVGEGQFSVPEDLPYGRSDEIGSLARAFRRMADRLSELERLRAEFMAAVTHDLKNPINVIMGYAEMLSDGVYGEASDRQVDASRRIGEQAKSLASQIEHLTDLSRMEAGGFRIEPAPVDTDEILTRAERSFRALADQRGVRFTVRGSDAPSPITVDADRVLHEVLGNLLGNAFKFTGNGGEVVLEAESAQLDGTSPPRAAVRMTVGDTGKGIPEDELPHVFDRYFHGGNGTGGSGLGLAIARQVVEAHGGTVTVASQEGAGTTFTVILPVEGPQAQATDAEER